MSAIFLSFDMLQGLDIHNGGNGVVNSYKITTEYSDEHTEVTAEMREVTLCIPTKNTTVLLYAVNNIGESDEPSSFAIPGSEYLVEGQLFIAVNFRVCKWLLHISHRKTLFLAKAN